MKVRGILLTTMVYLSFCGHALAWGDTAHQVICEIAFRLARPATQVEIRRLIDADPNGAFPDFSESCVYPDHPLPGQPRIRRTEHYINLPRNSLGLTSDKCPLADKCVLTAILDDRRIVSSKNETDAKRLFALASLGHWVGDIHQPLHVSFEDDRGGNDIKVSGCPKNNLHAVWDTCLVEYAVGRDVPKAVAGLMGTITPAMEAQWSNSGPRDWANETFAIAKAVTTRYCVIHDQSCDLPGESLTITTEYLEANKSVVKEQLQKAGVRLAHILDAAFGN
jgi:hypothetical protein